MVLKEVYLYEFLEVEGEVEGHIMLRPVEGEVDG